MTKLANVLGIPTDAMPAWLALCAALDRLADDGRAPVCQQRPDQWSDDARPHARRDAAEGCTFCPALHPCAAFAEAAAEKHHIWGGIDRATRPTKEK